MILEAGWHESTQYAENSYKKNSFLPWLGAYHNLMYRLYRSFAAGRQDWKRSPGEYLSAGV